MKVRIKEVESLRHKAVREGWPEYEAVSRASDLIGARIVCNNLCDVARIVQLIKEVLPFGGPPAEIQDYIKDHKDTSYLAIHINFRIEVGRPLHPMWFGCEVQVRTLLQDAWSQLSHDDIYKDGDTLPPDLRERATDLAHSIASADTNAQRIRARITEEHRIGGESDVNRVSADGLSFIFAEVFGRAPAAYVVNDLVVTLERSGVDNLENLRRALGDETLRSRIERAYSRVAGWTPSPEDVTRFVAVASIRGQKAGVRAARLAARREIVELDARAYHELESDLPDNPAEFLEQLESGDINIEATARLFDALDTCAICSADIVGTETFEQAAAAHYGIDSFDGKVEAALVNSGVETGHYSHSHLCAYHGDQIEKDD